MRAALASLCVVLTASLNMEDMDSMNVCGVDAQQKGGAWSFKDCDGFTLFQIYLGPDGAEAVAAGLAENQRNHGNDIKLFQVAKAGTGNAGGTALARALKDHAELRTIDLRGNELGDETMLALAETLGSTTSKRLEVLRLDYNAIGDAGVGALAAALKPAVQLETLILNDNKIGDAGVIALANALTGDSGLAPLVDGYAPFCKHLFVPNFVGAKLNYLEITPDNESCMRSGYEARTEKELPVLVRWFPADLATPAPVVDASQDLVRANDLERLAVVVREVGRGRDVLVDRWDLAIDIAEDAGLDPMPHLGPDGITPTPEGRARLADSTARAIADVLLRAVLSWRRFARGEGTQLLEGIPRPRHLELG